MLSYYAGFYQMKNGNSGDAMKSLEQGSRASSDYCFPFRLEELEILESAIKENPSDAKACYYLGNLHYFLNQKDKAIADWERSVKLDDKFYLAFRNLGFAYDLVQSDVKKAIGAYEKAIALNTQDPRLYAEIDVLKSRAGVSPAERLAFLNKNIPTLEKRDDALTRLIELYNFTGSYDKALDIMTKRHFHVWEGGGNIHDVFVDANLLRGIKELGDKQYSKALKDFQCADTWPDNLEVGEPEDGGRRAQISYYTGLAYEGLKNSQASKEAFGKAMQLGGGRRINQGELGFYKAMALKKLGKADEAKSILEKIEKDANNQLKSSEGLDYFAKFGAASTRESRMADSYYLLGLASYGMGDKVKAKEYFTKVMELNQNHVWAKMMLESKGI
jgi:tetratricopeptide (TPR) repeat protein